jgi:hypothetical protein
LGPLWRLLPHVNAKEDQHVKFALDHINKIMVFVDGYNDDDRELYQIEEIRNFFFLLNQVYPEWPLFMNIEPSFSLTLLANCITDRPGDVDAIKKVLDDCFKRIEQYEIHPDIKKALPDIKKALDERTAK